MRATIEFQVVSVSENTNAFGLRGHVLVARDGTGMYSWPEQVQSFKDRFGALLNAEELDRLGKVEAILRRLSPATWAEWEAKQPGELT